MQKEKVHPGKEIVSPSGNFVDSEPLREFLAHLRQNQTLLREDWVTSITEARLLTAITQDEIFAKATSV